MENFNLNLSIFESTGVEGAPKQSTDAGSISAEAQIVKFLLRFDVLQIKLKICFL